MRIAPKSWHNETWVCSIRGHVTPASHVRTVRSKDSRLAVDIDESQRLARCLRCDLWISVPLPVTDPTSDTLPALEDIPLPRRGKQLEDAIFLRLIALDRAFHSIMFALLAIALAVLRSRMGPVHHWADSLIGQLSGGGHRTLSGWLSKLSSLHSSAVTVLMVMALAYAITEGIEAVGLWYERRWAEYLTVIATCGFLPLEIHELIKRVTVLRVSALIINIAIVIYLIWNKRLFGLPARSEQDSLT